ncbi:MAG: PilZ domain-containing protein [Deltaproteobacteria bacterium]|nr:MAG: PilZ domain-containing protein [Deltaproteobacteria bacterium]
MTRDAERRRRTRASFEGWVEVRAPGGRRRARGLDLSAHGIGLSIEPPHPGLGDSVTSEFALPGISPPVALEGDVVWGDAGGARIGLRFRSVDPGLDEIIERFVADRL